MIKYLTEKIMTNTGLDVGNNFILTDQDYDTILLFDNKYLKCSYNDEEPIIDNDDMYFDPTGNIKLMIFIFSYFINKYQHLTGNYVMSYCTIYNDKRETALDLKGSINITSNYYKSETLKYIDIIFRLSEYENIDFLRKYDGIIR